MRINSPLLYYNKKGRELGRGSRPYLLLRECFTVISLGIISVYAPAATKKKPIPVRLIKRKKYYAIIVSLTFFIITLIIKEPFAQFIQLGIIIEAITLLPIFFIKEDLK